MPPPDNEPAEEQGTRDNPWAIGDVVEISSFGAKEWELSLGTPNYDANQIVQDENMFNEAPPEGSAYAIVPVTVTYFGEDSATPWTTFSVAFVSASGQTYDSAYAVIPNPLLDIGDLYAGGTGTGNVAVIIPTSEVAGGTWRVTVGFSFEVFFAAQ